MSKSDSGGKKIRASSNPNIYEDNRKHSVRSGGQKKGSGARISAEERQRKREERADAAAKFLKGLGIFLIIVLMAVSAVTGAAAYVTYSDTVFPNVSVEAYW